MKKFQHVMKSALLVVASAAAVAPVETAAQNEPSASGRVTDVITVTARKKEETVKDAPLAVSAVSGAQLERAGIDSFDQVLNTIPNAGQSGGIAGSIQGLVSIRGISTLIRFVGLETGVGFYLDGVYMGRPENFNQDLIDIERIEVLRGPQGALFGKNTIAGAINIITKDPGDEFEGVIEGQYGNYDHKRVRGHISGALVPGVLAASVSAGYSKRDGFVEHVGAGPDLDTTDLATFRGKLRFTPADRAEFILSADGLIDRGDPAFFEVADFAFFADPSFATPFTTNHDQPNFLDRDVWGLSLTSNIGLGAGEWTTVIGYRDSKFDAGLDDDKTDVRVFVDFFGQETEAFSIESRYAGEFGDRLDYIVGVYYLSQSSSGYGDFALGDFLTGFPGVEPPITLDSAIDTDSFALFFNGDYSLTDRLSLAVGGRWVSETKDALHVQDDTTGIFGSTSFETSRTDRDFAPTASLSYDVSDSVTGYLRFAQGFKSAGFNTDFVSAGANLEVAPEFATSYEAGLKSALADNRLLVNLAGFYTTYKDLQLAQIVGAGVSLNNAAEAEIYGVEADFAAALGDYIDLNGSLGYLQATYEDFPGCPAPGAINPALIVANCSGNFLNLAPEWTAALGAQFTYPVGGVGDFVARADWNYRSTIFFEPQNDPRLSGDGRSLVNVRAGIVNDAWELFGWANNIADETYVNFADDRTPIGILTTRAYGAPRTYGVTLRLKF